MELLLKKLEDEIRLRGLSPQTLKAYRLCVKHFLLFLQGNGDVPHVGILDVEKIKAFLLQRQSLGAAPQTVNLYLNAIKFFCRHVVRREWDIPLRFAKRPQKLPTVLSHEEILRSVDALKNLKHKLLVSLAYGAGLRVSEVVRLRVGDVDFDGKVIYVRQGKGQRDRATLLPEKLENSLKIFCGQRDQAAFVFESERGGRLTTRSAQKVFESALRRAGIIKPATFHSLRHSFATHLLENGVDIRFIQELLGHQNIRTTQRYTRVTVASLKNLKSPL